MPEQTNRGWQKASVILAPVLMLVFCGALLVLCGIKPYEKLTTYLNIVFMDTQKIQDPNAGLIIKDKNINTDYQGNTSSEGSVIYPSFGEQYAVLKSEAISLNVPVYWGSNATLLKKGACQPSGSSLLGAQGNAVIDAHVNTFFADLAKLKPGDTVEAYTDYGTFIYTVREVVYFDKNDKTYVLPLKTGERLTLYTCVADVLGSSSERVAVLCDVTDKMFYDETAQNEGGETE